jgi:hypothetical protein
MSGDLAAEVGLGGGERWLGAWPVEAALPDGGTGPSGWLVLTSRRTAFYRKLGLFGSGRLEKPPQFSWPLEDVRSVESRRYEMKIGYGDRLVIPGVAVNGQGFRLNRETPSPGVVEALERARKARRSELGLPLL